MRIFSTLLCALVAAPAILALPSIGSLDITSSLMARDEFEAFYANSTLEARTNGGRDHCRKGNGRRNDDCSCYPGLGCHNKVDKCECGDKGNAKFDFCSTCHNDEPKCLCTGDNQHYNKREMKCFCDEGFDANYGNQGKLQCTRPKCGDHQHYNKQEKECACNDGFFETTENNKLFCKQIPPCGSHQHFDHTQAECVCDNKYQPQKGATSLVCEPCVTTCPVNAHLNPKNGNKCVCDTGYKAVKQNGKLIECVQGPTPSKRYNEPRSIETGVPASLEFSSVEDALGCSKNEIACKIATTWTCFDSSSNLASCGGCPGEGVDCSSIEKVDEVRCAMGKCVVDSCLKGYSVDSTAGTCVARGQFWSQPPYPREEVRS